MFAKSNAKKAKQKSLKPLRFQAFLVGLSLKGLAKPSKLNVLQAASKVLLS